MAIICVKLGAEATFTSNIPELMVDTNRHSTSEANLPSRASEEEALRMGDYRDILSLTRVLMYGPQSKSDVDIVIERYIFLENSKDYNLLIVLPFYLKRKICL